MIRTPINRLNSSYLLVYCKKGGVLMILDTREMISVTEANQNFSRATRIADQRGKAVILKGNRPKYVLLDIEADPRLLLSDDELIGISATRIFKNHRAAFEELAK